MLKIVLAIILLSGATFNIVNVVRINSSLGKTYNLFSLLTAWKNRELKEADKKKFIEFIIALFGSSITLLILVFLCFYLNAVV